ncbi:unnamed protein product [Ostreobium quekettii]|uniref:Uncharacterized protein n=1 Tax=Ostreobium quekettii TaxID=121088 RepID=A0A8S1INZ3_9CHLO|nr:unnamed protein product [Ostreobium quekettii]|eukprot:evm.model.scf_1339.2 EVM.evm.TU.scf_1339.2   scf_1339:20538-23121(+)
MAGPGPGPLTDLLARALPAGPSSIDDSLPVCRRRCAVVALSLHCMMVWSGFRRAGKEEPGGPLGWMAALAGRRRRYAPPERWLEMAASTPEWYFRYTHPNLPGLFLLGCSVQESTMRMIVHVREQGWRDFNAGVMLGLDVGHYAVAEEKFEEAAKKGWEGLVTSQNRIWDNFYSYISEPLIRKASQSDEGNGIDGSPGRFRQAVTFIAKISVVALVAAGAATVVRGTRR